MHMYMKKPSGSVSEMVRTNVRTKPITDPIRGLVGSYETATLVYPEGHPRRIYKDAKRALKAGK